MSFSFGSTSAPASSGLAGGFSFGAAKPATPGFGLTATSQPSGFFGSTATSTPTFGATTAFGASTTPAFGANTSTTFGAGTPAFGSTSFGASATPAFGATSAAPAFGATATPAFGTTSMAPTFGATATPTFGATSSAPAFGSTATPAFGVASSVSAFGSTTTPAFGSTATSAFGATTTPAFGATSQPAFGATTTPAFGQTSAPSFGAGLSTGGLNFGASTNTSTASTGLSFGAPATSANTGLGGLGSFGFGAAPTQTSFGFGTTANTSNSLFGGTLGMSSAAGTQLSTTVTPSLGLGGLTQSGMGTANATTGDGKSEPPKQNKLPNEILTNVESFKEFVKKQKSISSDIMRVSIKPLHKVSVSAESTLRAALALRGEVGRARAAAARLRSAAASANAHADNCARDALGTELEGMAPPPYIKELLSELEQQIITFRRQLEVADKQMQSSPKLLTEQELTLGIRRMHESLVALAGRLQAVHTQVEAQKEQYLNLRKYMLKDSTDVFNSISTSASLDQILRDAEGTRNKSKTRLNDSSLSRAVLSDPRVALGSISQLAGPTPFSYLGDSLSPFPGADASGSRWTPGPAAPAPAPAALTAPADGSFQLQKPPGKRGKQ